MPIEKTPNFIRIRVADPKQCKRFRIKIFKGGIRAVICFKKTGGSMIQSLLFPRSRYTLAQAKAWVKAHKMKVRETFWVHEILLDPKDPLTLIFEETVAEDESDVKKVKKIDVKKMSKETWEWLLE